DEGSQEGAWTDGPRPRLVVPERQGIGEVRRDRRIRCGKARRDGSRTGAPRLEAADRLGERKAREGPRRVRLRRPEGEGGSSPEDGGVLMAKSPFKTNP